MIERKRVGLGECCEHDEAKTIALLDRHQSTNNRNVQVAKVMIRIPQSVHSSFLPASFSGIIPSNHELVSRDVWIRMLRVLHVSCASAHAKS